MAQPVRTPCGVWPRCRVRWQSSSPPPQQVALRLRPASKARPRTASAAVLALTERWHGHGWPRACMAGGKGDGHAGGARRCRGSWQRRGRALATGRWPEQRFGACQDCLGHPAQSSLRGAGGIRRGRGMWWRRAAIPPSCRASPLSSIAAVLSCIAQGGPGLVPHEAEVPSALPTLVVAVACAPDLQQSAAVAVPLILQACAGFAWGLLHTVLGLDQTARAPPWCRARKQMRTLPILREYPVRPCSATSRRAASCVSGTEHRRLCRILA